MSSTTSRIVVDVPPATLTTVPGGGSALTAARFAVTTSSTLRIPNHPLLLSLAYHRVGGELMTYSGHMPETFARHAVRHGVAALGVNCGKDIDLGDVCEILRRYRAETDLPLFARPNAGTPVERRQAFRIGMHLGDIIVSDEDVFGDTVNVASRL